MSRHSGPIAVARHRGGRMVSVRYFTNREVGPAIAYITAIESTGDTAHVTVAERDDGTGVPEAEQKLLGVKRKAKR